MGLAILDDGCPAVGQHHQYFSLFVELKPRDADGAIVEEDDSLLDAVDFEEGVALRISASGEDLRGEILLLGISEDAGDEVLVEFLLEGGEAG